LHICIVAIAPRLVDDVRVDGRVAVEI